MTVIVAASRARVVILADWAPHHQFERPASVGDAALIFDTDELTPPIIFYLLH
jgi:hypothetical protein